MKQSPDIVMVRLPKVMARQIDEAISNPVVVYKETGEPIEVRPYEDRQHFVRIAVGEQLKREARTASKEAA